MALNINGYQDLFGATPATMGDYAAPYALTLDLLNVAGSAFGKTWDQIEALAEEVPATKSATSGWYKANVAYTSVLGGGAAGSAATLHVPWILYGPEMILSGVTYRYVAVFCSWDSTPAYDSYTCTLGTADVDAFFQENIESLEAWDGAALNTAPYSSSGSWYDTSLDAFGLDWTAIEALAVSYGSTGLKIAGVDYFYNPGGYTGFAGNQISIPYIVYTPEEEVSGVDKRKVFAFGVAGGLTTGYPKFLYTEVSLSDVKAWIDSREATVTGGDTVDGSFSGWTAYHDALVEELKGLIDHYGWQDDVTVVARVEDIQDELREVGQTLFDAPLNNMLSEFETARLNAEDANDSRYAQLIGDVSAEPDPEKLMSYTQLAKHMLEAHYDSIQDDMVNVQDAQELLNDDIVTELETMWTTLDAHFTTIFTLIERGGWNETKAKFWEMKLTMYQSATMARIEAMRAKAGNVMALELARVQWRQAVADRMAQLYQLAPAVVERRTDIGPSLADIANLTMNIGRGQGAQELLDSFSPTTFIAPSGSSSSGLGKLLTDATKKG